MSLNHRVDALEARQTAYNERVQALILESMTDADRWRLWEHYWNTPAERRDPDKDARLIEIVETARARRDAARGDATL